MSNRLEELHYQYKKYYLKKIIKIVGVSVVATTLFSVAYLLMQDEKVLQTAQPKPIIIEKVRAIEKVKPISLVKDNRQAYSLNVSVKELEASVQKIKGEKKPKIVSQTRIKTKPKLKKKESIKAPVQEEVQTSFFSDIQEAKSLDAWIDKYNKKKSYTTAIYISKQYYFDKNYKQSGIWAKRANQLNRNKEEAWLYYAKSMHALKNVPKAKRILNIYLQYKNSIKAELLLSEWNQ